MNLSFAQLVNADSRAQQRRYLSAPALFSTAVAIAISIGAHAIPSESAASAANSKQLTTLEHIRSTGKIILAHRESSLPFSYVDNDKHPIGYSLDICKSLAEAVSKHLGLKKLEIEYLPVTTATRISAIVDGKADLECGTTTNNAERRTKVAFTIPHYITGSRYLVRADSPISRLEEFSGHVLVATAGSVQFKQIVKFNRDHLLNINLREASDNSTAMNMVAEGQADGFAMDDVQLYGLVAASPHPDHFKVVGTFLTIEPLAIMMSKRDSEFKQIVDAQMRVLIRTGEAEALYVKWFEKPIPPNNVAMNLPMNYLLRDSWRYPSDAVGD